MKAQGPLLANKRMAAQDTWKEPFHDGALKHRRFIWIKRGGTGGTSGSGPQGWKATRRALLSRNLRERDGAAAASTRRDEANRLRKLTPRVII